jgi:hypothetical protein
MFVNPILVSIENHETTILDNLSIWGVEAFIVYQKCSRIVEETIASHAQGRDKSSPNRPAESLIFLHGTEIKT